MNIKQFVFNPFQVNTYLIFDDTGECMIIDPACSNKEEEHTIVDFISTNNLNPSAIINTHGHVDHICGNKNLSQKYDLPVYMHEKDLFLVHSAKEIGRTFGFMIDIPPEPTHFIDEGFVFNFGQSVLNVFYSPGHSPGSLLFYSEIDDFLIAGDVIFYGSIGRTDLPGGNYQTLIRSIEDKILVLPADTIIYPGHGEASSVGREGEFNPFLKGGY